MARWFLVFNCYLVLTSCSENGVSMEDYFGLQKYNVRHYDLYNPVLNSFKIDSTARQKHPNYFLFDCYYDASDTLRYYFARSESYGYLHQMNYDTTGRAKSVKIYPILAGFLDDTEEILTTIYYYDEDGNLICVRDEFHDRIILVSGDSLTIYEGIVSGRNSLTISYATTPEFYGGLW